MGDGERIRFWHDLWCGDSVLKEVFPDLFGIARVKDASVADNVEVLGGSTQWNVLHATRVNRDRADRLWWVASKKGLFKVKSFFRSLTCSGDSWFPWKCVWRTQAPPRAAFFTWSAALGKILTVDNLRKRHLIIVDRCCLYAFNKTIITFQKKKFCSLSIPENYNGLNSLSSLALKKTSLNQEDVDNILSSCPSLEWFSISECRCPFRLKLSSGCRFLRLRHLRIFRCEPLERVEIHDAIGIASIEYDAKMFGQVLLKNIAEPVRLCVTLQSNRRTLQSDRRTLQPDPRTQITYVLSTLAKDFPLVETLLVSTPFVQVDLIPKPLTTFTRLKQLKLLGVRFRKILLDLTSAFLEAAPSLVELEMDLHLPCSEEERIKRQKIIEGADYREHKKIPLKEYCQHQRLKKVELRGFYACPIEFDLAVLLLKNAILLEKMRIVLEITPYLGDGECCVMEISKTKIERERILKILGPEVPSTVNLVLE
ncbi:uncharacterized protein LOC133869164 [Alnus glutinosa]|uniref:uncharacterized protein LOC133869164 n=1 Tax=Alnus glutinosa TaxID=3517 RepID=UPI002D79BB9E|nr:uncharacterized protein LOC133869164 [Alnus glutinosa]